MTAVLQYAFFYSLPNSTSLREGEPESAIVEEGRQEGRKEQEGREQGEEGKGGAEDARERKERHGRRVRRKLGWKEGCSEWNLVESCMQAILLMLHYCRGLLYLLIHVYRCASRTTFALLCTFAHASCFR